MDKIYWNSILHDKNKQKNKNIKKLTNVCLRNDLREQWNKSHKKTKCIIKGIIRWKIS